MNQSSHDFAIEEDIQSAQQKLNIVEKRLKNFKKQTRNKINTNNYEVPYPGLSQFFSHFKQLEKGLDANFKDDQKQRYSLGYKTHQPIAKLTQEQKYGFHDNNRMQLNKQNVTINENDEFNKKNENDQFNKKFIQERRKALDSMQFFYQNKNEQLDRQIQELQAMKLKSIQDKQLLIRNNKQIQHQINLRSQLGLNQAANQIAQEIESLKIKTQNIKGQTKKLKFENSKLEAKKKQLRKNIQDCIKGQKNLMNKEIEFHNNNNRHINNYPKNNLHSCQYRC